MPRHVPFDMAAVAAQLGEKVRTRREQLGMTQEKLAEVAGVHRNQIQNIEHSRNNAKDPRTRRPGPANPRLDTVFAIANALQVEVSVLIDPAEPLPEEQR
jgi:transcriptional regulator with XRE-family HTH domain